MLPCNLTLRNMPRNSPLSAQSKAYSEPSAVPADLGRGHKRGQPQHRPDPHETSVQIAQFCDAPTSILFSFIPPFGGFMKLSSLNRSSKFPVKVCWKDPKSQKCLRKNNNYYYNFEFNSIAFSWFNVFSCLLSWERRRSSG